MSIQLVTKGILCQTPVTKGIICYISEKPIKPKKRSGGTQGSETWVEPIPTKKKVTIKYIYEGQIYTINKIVDIRTKVNLSNVKIEVVNNKPKIKIIVNE